MKFNTGDLVKCVTKVYGLTVGRTYEIIDNPDNDGSDEAWNYLIADNGEPDGISTRDKPYKLLKLVKLAHKRQRMVVPDMDLDEIHAAQELVK